MQHGSVWAAVVRLQSLFSIVYFFLFTVNHLNQGSTSAFPREVDSCDTSVTHTQIYKHRNGSLDILYGGFGIPFGKERKNFKIRTKETFSLSAVTTHIFHMGSTRESNKLCCTTMLS